MWFIAHLSTCVWGHFVEHTIICLFLLFVGKYTGMLECDFDYVSHRLVCQSRHLETVQGITIDTSSHPLFPHYPTHSGNIYSRANRAKTSFKTISIAINSGGKDVLLLPNRRLLDTKAPVIVLHLH